MRVRLEVGRSRRGGTWDLFVHRAQKHPSFQQRKAGRSVVVTLTFDDPQEFAAFFQQVCNWAAVTVYLNGRPVARDRAWELYWRSRGLSPYGTPVDPRRVPLTSAMLQDVLRRGGRGPDPCPGCGRPWPGS